MNSDHMLVFTLVTGIFSTVAAIQQFHAYGWENTLKVATLVMVALVAFGLAGSIFVDRSENRPNNVIAAEVSSQPPTTASNPQPDTVSSAATHAPELVSAPAVPLATNQSVSSAPPPTSISAPPAPHTADVEKVTATKEAASSDQQPVSQASARKRREGWTRNPNGTFTKREGPPPERVFPSGKIPPKTTCACDILVEDTWFVLPVRDFKDVLSANIAFHQAVERLTVLWIEETTDSYKRVLDQDGEQRLVRRPDNPPPRKDIRKITLDWDDPSSDGFLDVTEIDRSEMEAERKQRRENAWNYESITVKLDVLDRSK